MAGTYKAPELVRQFNTSSETFVQGGSNYAPEEKPVTERAEESRKES